MRKIIKIDAQLCNGCGECITACAEGAIQLHDGKARVVSDSFCDGLGACLSVCPQGALRIEEREASPFDEAAAREHKSLVQKHGRMGNARGADSGGTDRCAASAAVHPSSSFAPCTAPISLKRDQMSQADFSREKIKPGQDHANELCGWPIQMRLARPWAPYLKGARLLVAGDCTAFAYPSIQQEFIKGRAVLVGCPKLDEIEPFVEKLTEILRQNDILDIAVLHMTVPCCSQLVELVARAVRQSGKDVAVKSYVVGIDGRLING
ncbi:MAG: CoB--CoM heterodisulfide reductase iron-sulfur subunit A [Methanosaeta sp. PtaU1.Bin112]|nr:MAG: CoB--CoM heterodisulfide reductase iron-sulfur subunit A [Methanosaeta sp. PtaU1.Bin112]